MSISLSDPAVLTQEVTPWYHAPGQKRVVRSGVAQVQIVIVMPTRLVSSTRRKSLFVRGLGSVALGTKVGAAVAYGTGVDEMSRLGSLLMAHGAAFRR